jgi:hypothetical protein
MLSSVVLKVLILNSVMGIVVRKVSTSVTDSVFSTVTCGSVFSTVIGVVMTSVTRSVAVYVIGRTVVIYCMLVVPGRVT